MSSKFFTHGLKDTLHQPRINLKKKLKIEVIEKIEVLLKKAVFF